MVDRSDQDKNPEHEPSQKQLRELYGRLFGIATRHRNAEVDAHLGIEGPRKLPPHIATPEDAVSHSYRVTMSRQELELCGIDDVDRIDVVYADPRILEGEPAPGMTLLYVQSGSKEEILDVTYDAESERYGADFDARFVDPDVGEDEDAFIPGVRGTIEEELDEAARSLGMDKRPIDQDVLIRMKNRMRKIEIGFGIY